VDEDKQLMKNILRTIIDLSRHIVTPAQNAADYGTLDVSETYFDRREGRLRAKLCIPSRLAVTRVMGLLLMYA